MRQVLSMKDIIMEIADSPGKRREIFFHKEDLVQAKKIDLAFLLALRARIGLGIRPLIGAS
jgi:hypothetical protein